jgi:hypothetical protein
LRSFLTQAVGASLPYRGIDGAGRADGAAAPAAAEQGAPVGVAIADRGRGGVILGQGCNAIGLNGLPVLELVQGVEHSREVGRQW